MDWTYDGAGQYAAVFGVALNGATYGISQPNMLSGPGFKRHKGSSPERMGAFGFHSYQEYENYPVLP
jgi:hypothetical protein